MFAMIRHTLQRHKYKVVMGVPIAILVASSLSFVRSPDQMCLVPEDNRFVEVGEDVTLNVTAQSDEPVNVIGGIIRIPVDTLMVTGFSKKDSIIDLWVHEPTITQDGSIIKFSGGVVSKEGFTGAGHMFSLTVRPEKPGKATLSFDETTMLAHDGTGRPVTCTKGPITLSIRAAQTASPDVNGDKVVNIFDVSVLSARLFMAYDARYDLNSDGTVSMADLRIVVQQMGLSGTAGSLALWWRDAGDGETYVTK